MLHALQYDANSAAKLNVVAKITRARPTSSRLNPDYGDQKRNPTWSSVRTRWRDPQRERQTESERKSTCGVHYTEISRLDDAGWMDAYTTTTMIINIFSSWFLVFFFYLGSLAAFGIDKTTVGADLSWSAGTAPVESLRTRVNWYEWWLV